MATPVTMPETAPTVANALPELHTPPDVALESVVVLPMQTPVLPVIALTEGSGLTVTVTAPVFVQPLEPIPVIV
jgi:hypothetical protein